MKIQLLGHYYDEKENNMGDSAIERQVRADIRSIDPNVEFVNEVGPPDVFILGGGGMYSDWQPEAFDTWLPPIKWAQKNNIPVVAYGIGVGPLLTDQGRQRIREVFEKIELIMVRDNFSKAELGIDRAIVTADPAVRYERKRLKAGFNFVDIPSIPGLKDFLVKLGRYLQTIFDVEICCFWEPHMKFAKEIMAEMDAPLKILDLRNPLAAVDTIGKYDYWVGMQYHGCLFAVMNGVRTLSLSYHPKSCDLVGHMDIAQICVGDGRNLPRNDLEFALDMAKDIIGAAWRREQELIKKSEENVVQLKTFLQKKKLIR